MIPNFNENGFLPEGIHFTDFKSFSARFDFSFRRKKLLMGLAQIISILKKAGCHTIYIDGSFVTDRELPKDIDCCWEGDFDKISQQLLKLEPILLDFSEGRKKQKEKFGCEFFHIDTIFIDQYPDFIKVIDFFQQIKFSSLKKGIIGLNI